MSLRLTPIGNGESKAVGDYHTQWPAVIDRRSREIEEGKVSCRPVKQVVQAVRDKLHARRQPS